MKAPRPVVLIIAVAACSIVLALHHLGVFIRVSGVWKSLVGSLLHGDIVEGPRLLPWQYAYHTAVAFATAYVCAGMRSRGAAALFLAGVMFLSVTLALALATRGIVAEPLSGVLAALLAGVGGLVAGGTERGGRLVAFRDFFARRITAEKFDQLVVHRDPIKLSGTREATTVWCRILIIADLTHRMEVGGIEQLTSAFQKVCSTLLVEAGGYLDASNSQGVCAQFGFPLRDASHATQACEAALALKPALEELVADALKRWEQKPKIGIGIASGPVVCGLIGYEGFQSYSVMGAPVDVSRRLADTKPSGDLGIRMDGSTFEAVKEVFETKPGKDGHELVGRKS